MFLLLCTFSRLLKCLPKNTDIHTDLKPFSEVFVNIWLQLYGTMLRTHTHRCTVSAQMHMAGYFVDQMERTCDKNFDKQFKFRIISSGVGNYAAAAQSRLHVCLPPSQYRLRKFCVLCNYNWILTNCYTITKIVATLSVNSGYCISVSK